MGSAASRIGQPISKRGTQFIGDIRGQAAYGLPLESHPIQQVVAKSEPANYIANVLYPKASASGLPLLMPRSYALTPVNGGLPWGSWRKAKHRANLYKFFFATTVGLILTVKASHGGKFNKSWRGGDSVCYGPISEPCARANEVAYNIGRMYH